MIVCEKFGSSRMSQRLTHQQLKSSANDSSQRSRHGGRTFRRRSPTALMLSVSLIALVFAPGLASAANPSPVQLCFSPLPEAQVQSALGVLYGSVGSTIRSVTSVVSTGNGTFVYYDQWEDGYEIDLANPVQPSTLVLGDNNPANGDASTLCGGCSARRRRQTPAPTDQSKDPRENCSRGIRPTVSARNGHPE